MKYQKKFLTEKNVAKNGGYMIRFISTHVILMMGTLALFVSTPFAGDIISEWENVTVPNVPEIQSVTVDPTSTALLILDIEERTCNQERRPRCLDTVPHIAGVLEQARAEKMMVVYSLTRKGTPRTILPGVKPLGGSRLLNPV